MPSRRLSLGADSSRAEWAVQLGAQPRGWARRWASLREDLRPGGRPAQETTPPRAGAGAFAPCSLPRWEELPWGAPALCSRVWERVTWSTEACAAKGVPRLDNTDCFLPLLEAEAL